MMSQTLLGQDEKPNHLGWVVRQQPGDFTFANILDLWIAIPFGTFGYKILCGELTLY